MTLTLHEAMAYARTAPAWHVTATDTPDGREFTWERPADCTDFQAAHMERRLHDHNWLSEPDDLAAGDYLAVPTLWGVELRRPDATNVPWAGVTARQEPSGCRWCGIPQREHAQQWVSPSNGGPGWHTHTPPTDAQILARMRARRAANTLTRFTIPGGTR